MAHNYLAWQLCICPPDLRNAKEALASARKAIELDGQALHLNTLGVALYRSGDLHEAISVLEKSLAASKGESDAFDLFFLAMCHHRLGNPTRAMQYHAAAQAWFEENRARLSAQWVQELTQFQAEAHQVFARSAAP
jgi:tetratricopeptide (TPR) repeat protein